LNDILSKQESALLSLKQRFQEQGWAFVILTDDLINLTNAAKPVLLSFFDNPGDEKRWKYTYGSGLGFYSYPSKCGFRLLTGKELHPEKTLPTTIQNVTVPLVNEIEQKMIKIVEAISSSFFGISPEEAGKKLDLPLLLENDPFGKFGMVDVAYYNNHVEQKDRPPLNCVEHYDPGLISLSVIQTHEGLQLQDSNGKWIDGPSPQTPNLGVIWTGNAAKQLNNSFKAGIHRVIYPAKLGTPRMSIWGEVCTRDQVVFDESSPYNSESSDHLKFNGPTQIIIPNIMGMATNYLVAVEPGKLLEALRLVEKVQGLPFSKVMRIPVYNDKGEITDVK